MYTDCEYRPLAYRVYIVSTPEQEIIIENAYDAWDMFEEYVLNNPYPDEMDEQELDDLICELSHDFTQYDFAVYFDARIEGVWNDEI